MRKLEPHNSSPLCGLKVYTNADIPELCERASQDMEK